MMRARILHGWPKRPASGGNHDADGLVATHFHPNDFGAAIVSIDPAAMQAMRLGIAPMRIGFGRAGRTSINPKQKRPPPVQWLRLSYTRRCGCAGAALGRRLAAPLDGHRVLFDGAYIEFVEEAGCDPYIAAVTLRAGQDSPAALLARAEQTDWM